MLVNVINEGESRIAIVHDNLLEELSIEAASHEQIEGNIYKARIVKIVPGLGAVFVEYGGARNGFLSLSDIRLEYFTDGRKDPSCLRKGQELLVQVKKGEIGQKGAALTTYASIPGRYLVFMPYVDKRGVSRKIEDDKARKQLLGVLEEIGVPESMGYIARTAAMDQKKQDLSRDASYLTRLWKRIQDDYESAKAPGLLYQESDIVIRTIRDYFGPSVREVWVDDEAVFKQVKSFFRAVMPWHQRRVKFYQGKAPLFSKYNLEQQIASINKKTVPLPSGGSIIIEQTEALVSVDVNSGKSNKGKDIEETAFITNQEAAAEVARQLRLRDMGGLVVIDFIDMRNPAQRNELKKNLQKALKEDKARTDIGSVSKFGLIELSRQRIKPSASKGLTAQCPLCEGRGRIQSLESSAISVLRLVQSGLANKQTYNQILVGVPTDAAIFLLNRQRNKIAALEAEFGTPISILAEPALQAGQHYIEFKSDEGVRVEQNLPHDFPKTILKTPKGMPGGPLPPRQTRPLATELEESAKAPLPKRAEAQPSKNESSAQPDSQQRDRRRRRRKPRRSNGDAVAPKTAGQENGKLESENKEKKSPAPEEAAVAAPVKQPEETETPFPVAKKILNWVKGRGKQQQKELEKEPKKVIEKQTEKQTKSSPPPAKHAPTAEAASPEKEEAKKSGDKEEAGQPRKTSQPRRNSRRPPSRRRPPQAKRRPPNSRQAGQNASKPSENQSKQNKTESKAPTAETGASSEGGRSKPEKTS